LLFHEKSGKLHTNKEVHMNPQVAPPTPAKKRRDNYSSKEPVLVFPSTGVVVIKWVRT
jgi:hypothetical protein